MGPDELKEGERIIPNPGNKLCRICRSLITDDTLVRHGCMNRHLKCVSKKNKAREERQIRVMKRQRRRFIQLKDDTPSYRAD
jgi:hypothetical protein